VRWQFIFFHLHYLEYIILSFAMSFMLSGDFASSSEGRYTIACNGAGSGKADMAIAIPIPKLVWLHHTTNFMTG
jgi:hypothetical protein